MTCAWINEYHYVVGKWPDTIATSKGRERGGLVNFKDSLFDCLCLHRCKKKKRLCFFMMPRAIVFAVLLQVLCIACGMAQNPPPPMMSDTFQASGEVEFHGAETTDFGTCKFSLSNMHA